ncbi:MAG TPA: hypothetical protein VGZ48_04485 [Candidatus Acidoferrales bacterium]|jgi:hypothetical protein|nr:hypothetical protein [Candidatus Acidoferrales bacterium]
MDLAPATKTRRTQLKRFRIARWVICGAFLAFAISAPIHFSAAQLSPEIIGRVEGLDFTVEPSPGAPPPAADAANQLTSGSRIIVRSGQARIVLQDGAEILICGAARLQLLKSGEAITVALDYGTLRVHVESASPVAIYTPQVIATTVAVGGARDATIGLDQDGRMCIRAALGAVRIQQQFGDQTLLVPQLGMLSLSGSQIAPVSSFASGCTCNLDAARLYRPRVEVTVGAISRSGSNTGAQTPAEANARNSSVPAPNAPAARNGSGAAAPVPPVVDDVTDRFLMPALRFDASSPGPPPDTGADTILLVRTAVVHGEVVYRGTIVPGKNQPTKMLSARADAGASQPSPRPGVMARIGGFFRKLFGG